MGTGQATNVLPTPDLLRSAPQPPKRRVGRPKKIVEPPKEAEDMHNEVQEAVPTATIVQEKTYKVHVLLSVIRVLDDSKSDDSSSDDDMSEDRDPDGSHPGVRVRVRKGRNVRIKKLVLLVALASPTYIEKF